jgi:hypothetical protein
VNFISKKLTKPAYGRREGNGTRFKTRFDVIFDALILLILTVMVASYLYVLVFVISASFCEPNAVYSGKVVLGRLTPRLKATGGFFRKMMIWVGISTPFFIWRLQHG